MKHITIAIVGLSIISGTISYGVRTSALQDELLKLKFKKEKNTENTIVPLDIEEKSDSKKNRTNKFERNQKLNKIAQKKQERHNKYKAAWKKHSQKRQTRLIRYLILHQ